VKSRSARLLLIIISCTTLLGCNRFYLSKTITPAALAEQVNQSPRTLKSLKGFVRVQIQSSIGNYVLGQKLWYAQPDKLRLEIVGIFGIPAILVTMQGEDFQLFVPVRNILIRGKAPDLGPAFSINDLLAGFLYGSRLEPSGSGVTLEENTGYYRVSWGDGAYRQQALIDKKSRILIRQRTSSLKDGTLVREVDRSSLIKSGDSYYPRRISIYDREQKQKVTFLFSQLEFDPVLPTDTFTLKLPKQYEERSLADFMKDYPF
jgi:outer membrane lipoprotein-sorting protein